MQLSLPFLSERPGVGRAPAPDLLTVGRQSWPVTYIRHRRARHYVLRLEDDGGLRVTIPRGGSRQEAERFAKQKAAWIARERYRRAMVQGSGSTWQDGSTVLLRGEERQLVVDRAAGMARLGDERIPLPVDESGDLRKAVTMRLRALAKQELPARLMELAAELGARVTRVTVRNQRSRWGSCSPSGRISLNWRLIQVPPPVRDYVLLHELMHLQEANHSTRFWAKLEAVCPWQREARAWLKTKISL